MSDLGQAVPAWMAPHDIREHRSSADGLALRINGDDPYIHGPLFQVSSPGPLWLEVDLFSEDGGTGQIFYYMDHPQEANSLRFSVKAGLRTLVKLPLPQLDGNYRFRFDPPGRGGMAHLYKLTLSERLLIETPIWQPPEKPRLDQDCLQLERGHLHLRHDSEHWDRFAISVGGVSFASGWEAPVLAYRDGPDLHWLSLVDSDTVVHSGVQFNEPETELKSWVRFKDQGGAQWELSRRWLTSDSPKGMEVVTSLRVDRDREIVFFPLLFLFAGLETFGPEKTQAILPGLEYLANEPSSSEADVIGPASKRLVAERAKVTFPMMTLVAKERYLSVVWEQNAFWAPVFDSPDRQFDSGGHLLGLVMPGSDGVNRDQGSLLPYGGERLKANEEIVLRTWLFGGYGETVVPSIQSYVAAWGLPDLPPRPEEQSYFQLAAEGWLSSDIRDGALLRHAVWGDQFKPQPAIDAPAYMRWLSARVDDQTMATSLDEAANSLLSQVAPSAYSTANIGHIRRPFGSLVFGHVEDNLRHAARFVDGQLNRFVNDEIRYTWTGEQKDLGATHFSESASGLTGQVVAQIMDFALFSGDRTAIKKGLERVEALRLYQNQVPRGGQTWEVPLHTPDILASASMVKAYSLAYELTSDERHLEAARYWAWTGVPFVYLVAPTDNPIGLYNTIPVYGATQYQAPVWIGLPVQWCGMVYAAAIRMLAEHDPQGPWLTIADGITLAGIQHTYPLQTASLKGLLPDLFQLKGQVRDGPAINPGTVQSGAIELYGGPSFYRARYLSSSALLVLAAGDIDVEQDGQEGAVIRVKPWSASVSFVVIHSMRDVPEIVNLDTADRQRPDDSPLSLIVRLAGPSRLKIDVNRP